MGALTRSHDGLRKRSVVGSILTGIRAIFSAAVSFLPGSSLAGQHRREGSSDRDRRQNQGLGAGEVVAGQWKPPELHPKREEYLCEGCNMKVTLEVEPDPNRKRRPLSQTPFPSLDPRTFARTDGTGSVMLIRPLPIGAHKQ